MILKKTTFQFGILMGSGMFTGICNYFYNFKDWVFVVSGTIYIISFPPRMSHFTKEELQYHYIL